MRPTYDIVLFGMISRHPGKNRGGVSMSVRRLANALNAQGTRVAIVTSQAACHDEWLEGVDPAVTVIAHRRLSRLRLSLAMAQFLAVHRPRAVIAFDQRAGLILRRTPRLPGTTPRLFWSPRVAVSARTAAAGDRARARRVREIRAIHRDFDGIIAISHGLAEDLTAFAGIPADAITTIHNPVIDAAFSQAAARPCPKTPEIPPQRCLIVTTGRLTGQKDHATLIDAFGRVQERVPSHLLIIGEGPERAALEHRITEAGLAGHVSLPGHITNPLPLMARADVFALSSRWEGFGNVLAEALALGRPVVATDCPFGPREILDHGRYGALTPVGDADAMADALLQTLAAPPAPAHQRTGSTRFDAEHIAARYRQLVLART